MGRRKDWQRRGFAAEGESELERGLELSCGSPAGPVAAGTAAESDLKDSPPYGLKLNHCIIVPCCRGSTLERSRGLGCPEPWRVDEAAGRSGLELRGGACHGARGTPTGPDQRERVSPDGRHSSRAAQGVSLRCRGEPSPPYLWGKSSRGGSAFP